MLIGDTEKLNCQFILLNNQTVNCNRQKIICVCFLLLCSLLNHSQTCDCAAQFDFILKHIEANNPAYHSLNSDSTMKTNYYLGKNKLLKLSEGLTQTNKCLDLINQYLHLLNDRHTSLYLAQTSDSIKPPAINENKIYEFKALTDKINYLKLSGFSRKHIKTINHFLDSLHKVLSAKPYLIIDLRDNSGGSDEAWQKLLKYTCDGVLYTDKVEVWASENNISYYEKYRFASKPTLDKLKKQQRNQFITVAKKKKIKYKRSTLSVKPLKIIILQNKLTASTAEDFILYAMQSKKVITMGANTAGFTGYGNVVPVASPNNVFILNTTTNRFQNGRKYEFLGIPPQLPLTKDKDWVQEAILQFN